jgi:hypothetical protein
VRRHLRSHGWTHDEFRVIAATGKAAAQVHGSTFASFKLQAGSRAKVGGKRSPYPPGIQPVFDAGQKERIRKRYGGLRVIFIDEYEMLRLPDFAWLKAICEAAKGNTIPWGNVLIVAIGDPFQLPGIGSASVYAGAATLKGHEGDSPEDSWKQLVTGLHRKHGNSLKNVLDDTKPYNIGGWIALHSFTRCTVLIEQMRADGPQWAFMQRVRWGYTRDDGGEPWPRIKDKRQHKKRGRGPNSGRYTKAAEEARDKMIQQDAMMLSALKLQSRSAKELRDLDFASAPPLIALPLLRLRLLLLLLDSASVYSWFIRRRSILYHLCIIPMNSYQLPLKNRRTRRPLLRLLCAPGVVRLELQQPSVLPTLDARYHAALQ